ncbi:MAG TPA: PEP-CTERM sorting domain-containing protein, partial [Candidatus Hypogeohydataceae bacterium YC40]
NFLTFNVPADTPEGLYHITFDAPTVLYGLKSGATFPPFDENRFDPIGVGLVDPTINITVTTPEPSTLLLLGSGLAGLFGLRRKGLLWRR